ncbi:MAG TPA: hypothetical protein VGQ80_07575 [Acidimicrobiia bacterium]|nr:hypothetical protein [Acidimicrobiia bacterium]
MARPQQPELARSGKTDLDPDHVETGLEGQPIPPSGGETGPIPVDNQPGHHPAKEQDKPDLDAFAARLGTDPTAPSATNARKPPRPKAAPVKGTASKAAPSKAAPSKAAPAKGPAGPPSRPASTSTREPAPPPRIQTTPANRPAAAPGWPESAPAPDDLGPLPDPPGDLRPQPRTAGDSGRARQETAPEAGLGRQPDAVGMSGPQPPPDGQPEPRLVGLVLLPLRETVKRLEQLDRSLTERLARSRLSARGGLGPRGR